VEGLAGAFVIIYLVGFIIGAFVLPWRVGLNRLAWLGAFAHPGSRRNGIPWALKSYVKLCIWPIVFGMWLAQGRPPSPVLYGEDAAEALYGDPSRAMPGFMTKWNNRP
jgi:hypothetical protein